MPRSHWLALLATLLFFVASCASLRNLVITDPCNCTPGDPYEFRRVAKHVPLPGGTPMEISVATMLGWPQNTPVQDDTPRTGRELQLFHIAKAFVQSVWVNPGDCDIHLEISDTDAKDAPRVIIETPRDPEFCPTRRTEQTMITNQGMMLETQRQEVDHPFPVSVLGLAFQDIPHNRGSAEVATVWELHPAIASPE